MNDCRDFLENFAQKHVLPAFRERFVHEALNKPQKLEARICHEIDQVFPGTLRGGKPPFQASHLCIPIAGIDAGLRLKECLWSELAQYVGSGGWLVSSADGNRFYAETECEHGNPVQSYANG
jgi:hypothetical protein